MGQVPVKVIGEVEIGDYILPSGSEDGFAIAVHPNEMLARDYQRIVGIAWEDSDGESVFSYIKTAVGINANDMAGVVEKMQIVLNQLQSQIVEMNPAFKPHYFEVDGDLQAQRDFTSSPTMQQIALQGIDIQPGATAQDALTNAMAYANAQGFDLSQYPYLQDVFSNPTEENAQKLPRTLYSCFGQGTKINV